MIIIETSVFTRQIRELLSDEKYRALQIELIRRPDAGNLIPGSGGLRKIRWSFKVHGKRGGVRVIYYWAVRQNHLLMLFIYPKNVQDDLSSQQVKTLKRIIEEEYHGQ